MIIKTCPDCAQSKLLIDFPEQSMRSDKSGTYCKDCMLVRSRESYRRRQAAMGKGVRERRDLPEGQRWCPDCQTSLSLENFPRNKNNADGRHTYCKPCHAARGQETVSRLYGSTRSYHLKHRYGITEADYDRMLEDQGGLCAICLEQPAGHVDHCHETGKVRGLTCFNCNGGLGQFKDRVDIMLNAIDYLERNSSPQWQKTLVSAGVYQLTTLPPATAASRRSSLPPRPTSFPPV